MKLYPAASTSAAAALAGVISLFQANAATADVVCEERGAKTPSGTVATSCKWTSPWGRGIAVRLIIGIDQNNRVRWVASPMGNREKVQTGLINSPTMWEFEGTDQSDLMMEVPWGPTDTPTFNHGRYQLRGGFHLDGVIDFWSGNGNDIVIGGDHTHWIFNGNDTPEKFTTISILHPNAGEVPWFRSVNPRHAGTTWQIVGPKWGSTQWNGRISLGNIGVMAEPSPSVFCNLSDLSTVRIDTDYPQLARRSGLFNNTDGVPNDAAAAEECSVMYLLALQLALNF